MLHDWRDDVGGDIAGALIDLIRAVDAQDEAAVQHARQNALKWLARSWYTDAARRAGLLTLAQPPDIGVDVPVGGAV